MADLWPEDFGTSDVTPPSTILREQALSLAKKTKGLIEGEVLTSKEGSDGFLHQFFFNVPLLDNYTYRLLTIRHRLQLYPADLFVDPLGQQYTCENNKQLEENLRTAFSSKAVLDVIQALKAQVLDVPSPSST